jgi:pyruvate formate lyase activating enzyme
MQAAGFIKNSFVDYPGRIASVVFVPGCNMDCWYCHNKHLWRNESLLDMDVIDTFLKSHRGFVDGVVISGGEPTLQPDLADYIKHVKDMGYLVKLDTNGLRPDVVRTAIREVDYIAMDLKAPPGDISRVVSFDVNEDKLWETAQLLMESGIDYEFRTTMMPLLSVEDIRCIAQRIHGAKKYALQQYRKTDSVGVGPEPHSAGTVRAAAEAAREFVDHVIVRGI